MEVDEVFVTNLGRNLCVAILFLATLSAAALASAESTDSQIDSQTDPQVEDYLARGGVVVTVGTATLASGSLWSGFGQMGELRSRDRVKTMGQFVADDATLSQRVMMGARPGDIIRIEFMPTSREAMSRAVVEMDEFVKLWEAEVTYLEEQRAKLADENEDNRRKSPSSEKLRKTSLLRNDLADLERQLTTAHKRANFARAQKLMLGANDGSSRARGGVFRPSILRFDLPVHHTMPISVDAALSKVLNLDESARARSFPPNVRIVRFESQNTNFSQAALKSSRRGMIGFAAGLAIMLEEITIGVISNQMTDVANKHFKPEIRTEPTASPSGNN